jgi:hypothetical protein
MQGYTKVSVRTLIPIHYIGLIEASMQGYSKSSVEPYISVHYNG